MDNLTHTLVAATLGRTRLSRAGRGTTAVLILASNAPDIDIVSAAGGTLAYLDWHRGPTHGVLGIAGLGLISAALVWQTLRWMASSDRLRKPDGPPASFWRLAALGTLGAAIHVCMDLPTSYGTRLLSPFEETWFTTDWMPIIDVYLIAVLGAGLAIGRWWRVGEPAAIVVIALVACNYSLRAVTHRYAILNAREVFGSSLAPACPGAHHPPATLVRWSRTLRIPRAANGDCLLEVAAIPTFTSPFSWRLVAQTSNAFEMHTVNVLGASMKVAHRGDVERRPNYWTAAVVRAAEGDVGRRFLSFARYPAAQSVLEADGSTTVRWVDGTVCGAPGTRQGLDRSSFFTATVRVSRDRAILEQRLGR